MEGRIAADAQCGPAVRPAVPRHDPHGHEQRVAARRDSSGRRRAVAAHGHSRQRRPLLRPRPAARPGERAAVGGQHDRRRASLRQIARERCRRRRPARPCFRTSSAPSCRRPHSSISRRSIRDLQNAYSRQASLEIERQIGRAQHGQRRVRAPARRQSPHADQPERARPARRLATTTAAGPTRPTPTTISTRPPAARCTTACTCRSCSGRPWGSYRVSYTYSKSMNNVGEAFFNSPIDPTDISKDWGRSDDDSGTVVVSGAASARQSSRPRRSGNTSAMDFS